MDKLDSIRKDLDSFNRCEREKAEKKLNVLEHKIQKYQQELRELGKVAFWMIVKLCRREYLRRCLSKIERDTKIIYVRLKSYLAAEKNLNFKKEA